MNSSNTCWLKPDDLKNLLEKNGITVNITDFTLKDEEKKEDKKDDKKKEDKKKRKKRKKERRKP
jgi:Zn-finger nucleic acid-binding protein